MNRIERAKKEIDRELLMVLDTIMKDDMKQAEATKAQVNLLGKLIDALRGEPEK